MKTILMMALAGIILYEETVFAQSGADNNAGSAQGVTKGYYAIGNNKTKLPQPVIVTAAGTYGESHHTSKKGYLAAAKKTNKKKTIVFIDNNTTPVTNKGYYSIAPQKRGILKWLIR